MSRRRVRGLPQIILLFLLAIGCCLPVAFDLQVLALPPEPATPLLSELLQLREDSSSEPVAESAVLPASDPESKPLTTKEVDSLLATLPSLDQPGEREFECSTKYRSPPPITHRLGMQEEAPIQLVKPSLVPTGELKIVRFSPEGNVGQVEDVLVTFSHPMVSLSTHEQLAKRKPPAKIEPQIAGEWQWIDATTARFVPSKKRFPYASRYTVTIEAGQVSVSGRKLKRSQSWEFCTAPPKAISIFPSNTATINPNQCFIVCFNQPIDQSSALKRVHLLVNKEDRAICPVDLSKAVNTSKERAYLESCTSKANVIAFRTSQPLPLNSSVKIVLDPVPSLEGPLLDRRVQFEPFRTFDRFTLLPDPCGSKPRAFSRSVELCFSNPVAFPVNRGQINVNPAPRGLEIDRGYGRTVTVSGSFLPDVTYEITVNPNLKDCYGQTLGKTVTRKVKFDHFYSMSSASGFCVVSNRSPVYRIDSENYKKLRIYVYSVQAEEYSLFDASKKLERRRNLLVSRNVLIKAKPDQSTVSLLDLKPWLRHGCGNFLVRVDTPDTTPEHYQSSRAWVNVTGIGVSSMFDEETLFAWTTSLHDGRALPGAQIKSSSGRVSAYSASDGIARLVLKPNSKERFLIVRKGDDCTILPASGDCWQKKSRASKLLWYVVNDRSPYQPGERVYIKGILRRISERQNGKLLPANDLVHRISYSVRDSQEQEIVRGLVPLTKSSAFDFNFVIPQSCTVGDFSIELAVQNPPAGLEEIKYSHVLSVEEFRRPEFTMNLRSGNGTVFVSGEEAVLKAETSYYAGGALPHVPVRWDVTAHTIDYQPPGWSQYTFGENGYEDVSAQLEGTTNEHGQDVLHITFGKLSQPRACAISVQGTVQDVNRQTWSADTQLTVHPSSLYVGLIAAQKVQSNTKLPFSLVVTDRDGKTVEGMPVIVENFEIDSDRAVLSDKLTLQSALSPVSAACSPSRVGRHMMRATVYDSKGRANIATYHYQVLPVYAGQPQTHPQADPVSTASCLQSDKEQYNVGELAELSLSTATDETAESALLAVLHNGIFSTCQIPIHSATEAIKIPIRDDFVPNATVMAHLLSKNTTSQRPLSTDLEAPLNISTVNHQLSVKITAEKDNLTPGARAHLSLLVRDGAGKPVKNAEVTVGVVDQALLALSDYSFADPLATFFPPAEASVTTSDSRDYYVDARSPLCPAPAACSVPGAGAGGGADGSAPRMRANFDPLAFWSPSIVTNEDGTASLDFKLPDNVSQYKILAVAQAGASNFGLGDSTLTVNDLPLIIKPSPPRFLTIGDQMQLPVVIQNKTSMPLSTSVALRVSKNGQLNAAAGQRIVVPAHDRVEVRFPVSTTGPGLLSFQAACHAGDLSDACSGSIPIHMPTTTESFATYGEIDSGCLSLPVALPAGVDPKIGGLTVSTSSTALHTLTDAFLYLYHYPFECSEQISSRIMSVILMESLLKSHGSSALPAPSEVAAVMGKSFEILQSRQLDSGGFGLWTNDPGQDYPFVSVHVAHALVLAKKLHYRVPEEVMSKCHQYVKTIDKHIPSTYRDEDADEIRAYALYVRKLLGDKDGAAAHRVLRHRAVEDSSLDELGWLLPVFSHDRRYQSDALAIRRFLENNLQESGLAAQIKDVGTNIEYRLFSSKTRTQAVLLNSLIADGVDSHLAFKLMNGLVRGRRHGRWNNTQENAFVLLAMRTYQEKYEPTKPDFVARLWLDARYIGETRFRAFNTPVKTTAVPMQFVVDHTEMLNMLLAKEGKGRLYYRVGLNYAPSQGIVHSLDRGFHIERKYEPVDSAEDVTLKNGSWHIKAGSLVRICLKLDSRTDNHFVAVVDPLPAGLEPVNDNLRGTQSVSSESKMESWLYNWTTHTHIRSNQIEVFADDLNSGPHEYTYVARATTPGLFTALPPKVEEMYAPEIFGHGASEQVEIF